MNKDEAGITVTNLLNLIQIVGSSGTSLLTQARLHAQLAQVEWAQEKQRLSQMFLITLLGFSCLLCLLLVASVILLALTWDSPYRLLTALMLLALYATGVVIAWRRVKTLANRREQAFAATREELTANFALLMSRL